MLFTQERNIPCQQSTGAEKYYSASETEALAVVECIATALLPLLV